MGMLSALMTTTTFYNKIKKGMKNRVKEHADRLMMYPQLVVYEC